MVKNINTGAIRREPTLPDFNSDKILLSDIKSCVEEDLAEMEQEIERGFASEIELVSSISTHIAGFGGKRLRPLTVVLAARALGCEGKLHCTLGAILEMLHGGTLLHDDVVDSSEVRRGLPSANMIWGNSASVLVGDFILSRSFELIAELQIPRILDILSYTMRRISEGEIMQLTNLRDANSDEANYFDTIERKTAALFEASARLGALAADASPDMEDQIAIYGRELGIAFQLQDDVLDYQGDTKLIGKKVGRSVRRKTHFAVVTHTNDCKRHQQRNPDSGYFESKHHGLPENL